VKAVLPLCGLFYKSWSKYPTPTEKAFVRENFPDFGLGLSSHPASRLKQNRSVAQTHFRGKLHQYYAQKEKPRSCERGAGIRAGVNSPARTPPSGNAGRFSLRAASTFCKHCWSCQEGSIFPLKQVKASGNAVFLVPQQVLRGSISNITKFAAFGRFDE
jgi:hypothetical protein